jgi:UDP-GlcNAc:undecaprenyl-phosphate/decaprenyl-phosphate GlcNAc-1-phosphate transferase
MFGCNSVFVDYSIFFGVCLAFSLLINGLFMKFVKTLGIRDNKETVIRWSSRSKPAMGGLSFYIIFLLSIIAYSFFFEKSLYFLNKQFIGILFASTLGFLMGLFDDAYNTRPLIKLFTQITCALILISTDVYIHLFANEMLNYVITLIWVVGIMNAINMLDNMDGITTIISMGILIAALINIFIVKDYKNPDVFVMLGILAALTGFLKFNWHPSSMYMGDTGSQFLGALLASLGIVYFWNKNEPSGIEIQTKQIVSAIIIFSVPIIDTTTVFFKRIRRGKSPFIGGKDHTTHHVSYLGFSDSSVALIYAGIMLVNICLSVIISNFIPNWSLWHAFAFGFYILIIFCVLFYIANINTDKSKSQ